MNDEPAIRVRNLWMTFPGKTKDKPVHVLENINLDVKRGGFVCIVGPSGGGKSTRLNIVGGFLKQSSGEVLVEGKSVTGPDPKRIFVFQENGVFPWLNVEDNVGFGLLGNADAERRRIVSHYVDMVGLTGFDKSYPRELDSRGCLDSRDKIFREMGMSLKVGERSGVPFVV